ncbi:MAG: DUF420 domain-containing protein [Nitrospirae bacterium]|nr:DUF420 domain-containing protein [Nitrospirota bacterium]
MKAWLEQPGFLSPYGTLGADLSYLLAVVFTVLFLIGWRQARRRRGQAHHVVTLWAMSAMLAYFVAYYVNRGLGALAFEGEEGFGGPPELYHRLFVPLLLVHIAVVSLGIVLAVYMIVLGYRTAVKRNGNRVLQPGRLSMSAGAFLKVLVGALAFSALLSAIRCHSVACYIVYVVGFLLVAFVLLVEKGIEWLIPDGERRHRAIGTFTMILYVLALLTSTSTYVLLYVIWPPTIGS